MPRMSKQRKQEWSLFLNERNSPADYSAVDAAIAKANGLNRDDYKDFSAVEAAINLVVPGKKLAEQADVDAMAQAIEDAIAALQYKDADYTKVDAAIAKANALNKDNYKDFSAVETAINSVVPGKKLAEQAEVDAMANGWASIFPIVSIVFVYYIVYMGAVANTSQTTMMGGILYAFILISNICFFLGEVATEKRYLTAEEYKQMMFEQEKTEAVMNLQEQHLKEMKGLIHDFEAQLNGLQLLARENKSEAFKKSIEEVRESIQERNDFYFVESKALQLILNQTNELCIKYGIEFCADIRYGNFLFMTFPDVFSLFENALCNAVNACLQLGEEEKKRIELRVFRQHEQIVVLLANTYNKANTRSNTYALHPHHEHGYGIQNIKRVIRKYNGTYLVKKEDVYKLMISFPLDVGNVKI